jgi:hypothetical protein
MIVSGRRRFAFAFPVWTRRLIGVAPLSSRLRSNAPDENAEETFEMNLPLLDMLISRQLPRGAAPWVV